MSAETILVRLKAIGSKRFRRDLEKDGAEPVDGLGDAHERTERKARRHHAANVRLTGGLKAMAVVMGVAAGMQGVGLLLSALGPATVAVLALTAAVGGLAAAVGVMGFAAVQHFKATKDIAGSAAADLAEQAGLLKTAFMDATGPGAEHVLGGLAFVLAGLRDLVTQLAPSFTLLGNAMSAALGWFGAEVRGLGPELGRMFDSTEGAWKPLAEIVLRLVELFARLATDAMPYVIDGLQWLAGKMGEWNAAVENGAALDAFATLGDIASRIGDVLAVILPFIVALAAGFGQIGDGGLPGLTDGVQSLTEAFGDIVDSGVLQTLGKIMGDTFGWAAGAIRDVAHELQSVGLLKPVILGIVAAITAWKVATLLLNMAMRANPIGMIITAVGALVVGVIYAYRKFDWFRNIVDGAWGILKQIGQWIGDHWRPFMIGLTGPVGLAAILIVDNFDKIMGAIQAVGGLINGFSWEGLKNGAIDVLNWIIDKLNWLIDKINKVNPFSDIEHVGLIAKDPELGSTPGVGGVAGPALGERGSHMSGVPGALGDSTFGAGNALTSPVATADRAIGGVVRPGEVTRTGEKGEEIAMYPAGTRIVPAADTRRVLEAARRARSGPVGPGPQASPSYVTVDAPVQVRIGEGVLAEAMAQIRLKVQTGIPV